MRQRLFDLIDEDQAEITCIEFFQRRVDGQEFAADLLDVPGAAGVFQPLPQEPEHFPVGASALALVLVQQHVVEGLAEPNPAWSGPIAAAS